MSRYNVEVVIEAKSRDILLVGCPFRGITPTVEPWHGGKSTKHRVSCDNSECWVNPGVTGKTKKEAITRWNSRVRYPHSQLVLL